MCSVEFWIFPNKKMRTDMYGVPFGTCKKTSKKAALILISDTLLLLTVK